MDFAAGQGAVEARNGPGAKGADNDSGPEIALQSGRLSEGLHLGGSDGAGICSRRGETFLLVTIEDCGEHNGHKRLLQLMWHYGIRLGF